jgi:DNA polymerase-3 subunit gamma/tau
MSYQVLARKWRPRSFHEMVGQAHVLKALINALDSQRLHHAYLFTGTRGVGKTSIARIIAKCLNCETGISSTPCGSCSVCREIDEGRFVDLIEVDAASRTKVEDTRELLDNVQYSPTRGRFKVYLIDEVHMLSSSSFNALLKTLEEPPPHVKFLLATTDPQKLPVTVLSRCLQFSLKNMPPERVVEHLTQVLDSEQIPFEQDALWLLGRAADGSMRDAMSLTDQAIAFGEGKVLAADVRAMLGSLDQGQVYGVLQALLAGDARGVIEAVRLLAEQGPDWSGVLAEMLNVLHRVAIAQALPEAVDNGQGDRERVLALAQALPAEDVQFYYQMGLIGRRDLPLAPDPRSGFEMVLLRMLAFHPAGEGGSPQIALKPLGVSQGATDSPSEPVSVVAPPVAPVKVTVPSKPELPTSAVSVTPPWDDSPAIPPVIEAQAVARDVDPRMARDCAPLVPVTAVAGRYEEVNEDEPPQDDYDYVSAEVENFEYDFVDLDADNRPQLLETALAERPASGLAADWLTLFPQLALSGMTASIAANCTLIAVQEDNWLLHLDPDYSALFNATQQRRLNDALSQFHGRDLQLNIELIKPQQETPAQALARQRAVRQQEAEASIHDDPLVQRMITQFAASVRAGSIEPIEHIVTPDTRTTS